MSDPQRFEEELRAYFPLEPSPRLREAIAAELEKAEVRRSSRRARMSWVFRGAAAAACLVLVAILVFHRPGDKKPLPPQQTASIRLTPEQIKALPHSEWGYQLAAQSSPEDRLLFLEHQADVLLPNVEKDGP